MTTAAGAQTEPTGFQPLGSRILFFDGTLETGIEPWVTVGTASGTRLLGDLCPGPCSSGYLPVIGRTGRQHRHLLSDARVLWGTDGRSEFFVRVVGPKPNGRLWPTLVRLSTSTLEVWLRQDATGEFRHYRLEGTSEGDESLDGLFDRAGFAP